MSLLFSIIGFIWFFVGLFIVTPTAFKAAIDAGLTSGLNKSGYNVKPDVELQARAKVMDWIWLGGSAIWFGLALLFCFFY